MPGFPVRKGVPADSRIEENGGSGHVEQVAPFEVLNSCVLSLGSLTSYFENHCRDDKTLD
jgi:hypothetical protein